MVQRIRAHRKRITLFSERYENVTLYFIVKPTNGELHTKKLYKKTDHEITVFIVSEDVSIGDREKVKNKQEKNNNNRKM